MPRFKQLFELKRRLKSEFWEILGTGQGTLRFPPNRAIKRAATNNSEGSKRTKHRMSIQVRSAPIEDIPPVLEIAI